VTPEAFTAEEPARNMGDSQAGVEELVTNQSPSTAKIKLFRSLFRGREDVYPRRFESRKTGRGGYQPACANEWVRGLCEKPLIKCLECPNRRFLPVTDDVVRQHLSGRDDLGREFVMGLYPLLTDETCHLLAVDLDGNAWQADIGALRETCGRLALPVALECSRSGKGGHLWLFFAEAIPASMARNVASYLLTETMEGRPEIGLSSYDRLFPNQDTMPKGGFGNLIALPLQKKPRAAGNSVFLDEQFEPYRDQWAFLSSVRKIPRAQAESLAREAERRGRVTGVRLAFEEEDEDLPWTSPPSRRRKEPPITEPLPKTLELVLGDQIYIAKEHLPPALRNRLIRLAAFQNPEFYRAQAMRLSTFGKPRVIHCAEDGPKYLALPRGCLEEAQALLSSLGIEAPLRDERFRGTPLDVRFHGELRPEQQLAADAMAAHDIGVLAATTAFGKTVLAAWLIARRGVNSLVLVHRQKLLEQWVERLASFLEVPAKSIGRLGGGRKTLTGRIDVALIQSLVRKGVVHDCVGSYGHLVVDECHHLPATSFDLVARRAKARYVTGLSASTTRKDGHQPIIFMQCGPVRFRDNPRKRAAARPFTHHVLVRPTGFRPPDLPAADSRAEFQRLYEALTQSPSRSQLICNDVIAAAQAGRFPLVLTERMEHLLLLATQLSAAIPHVITLRGGLGRKQIRAAMTTLSQVPNNQPRVLLATGRYIGEGFDEPRLDTLFITLPVSWRGTIAQYVGRLHRLHADKHEVQVYDYADLDVPMLARMFDRRCAGYEAVGYTLLLPASAVPGWPVEVPLPIEPEWRRDYSASVRRLVQDGVDVPLASLFVHAFHPVSYEAEGVARARSASEAFLYRRLQTLPNTANLFRLNAQLPIAFDTQGRMEVDFLCEQLRLVVELDGGQHLSDAEAYRRDRRKDAALQQHRYFVLRFLTEDLGQHLDDVLDAIQRAVAHQKELAKG
jgi:superfamily II DNA or RNA helicase/very-short-patch-repair endonuclease